MLKISVSTTALTYVKETLYAPADLDTAPVKGTEIPVMVLVAFRLFSVTEMFSCHFKDIFIILTCD